MNRADPELKSRVAFTNETDLVCPSCGGFNLHQYEIAVFARDEDQPFVTRTTVPNGPCLDARNREQGRPERAAMVDHVRNSPKNPSARRQGAVIRFWCEGCRARPELTIAQHKGAEEMVWRNFADWLND